MPPPIRSLDFRYLPRNSNNRGVVISPRESLSFYITIQFDLANKSASNHDPLVN